MRMLLRVMMYDYVEHDGGDFVHPLPCGGCGGDWLRGWYSDPKWGGDDRFYHRDCAEREGGRLDLVAARVTDFRHESDDSEMLAR